MKLLISALVIVTATQAFAFTEIKKFKCVNGTEVTLSSSLNPDGTRSATGTVIQTNLTPTSCESVTAKWSSHGSENCFVSDDFLFSHTKSFGLLRAKKAGLQFYTICQLTESIQ